MDGLGKNKLAYQDDAAVTTVIARKFYGDEPKVVVRISHDKSIVQDIS